jgi:hypothetical protein
MIRRIVMHRGTEIEVVAEDYLGECTASKEDWDIGEPIGMGKTIDEAIADLLEQLEERDHG